MKRRIVIKEGIAEHRALTDGHCRSNFGRLNYDRLTEKELLAIERACKYAGFSTSLVMAEIEVRFADLFSATHADDIWY